MSSQNERQCARRFIIYYPRPSTFTTGGVNTSIASWSTALTQLGHQVLHLYNFHGYKPEAAGSTKYMPIRHLFKSRFSMLPLCRWRFLRQGDVIWLHEGWTLSNACAALWGRLRSIPYIVTPHGVYEPAIVRLQRFKSLRLLIERFVLENANAVHVFFDSEAEAVRAIAPGATCLTAMTGYESATEVTWNGHGGFALFFGRLDVQHKGLDLLLDAQASISRSERMPLRIVGPDHLGGRSWLDKKIREMNLSDTVTIHEPLVGEQKFDLLRSATFMVHPARWESLGISLLEALSVGCPLVISRACRVSTQLEEAKAALICEVSVSSIAESMRLMYKSETRRHFSETGRKWLPANAAWEVVASKFDRSLSETLD